MMNLDNIILDQERSVTLPDGTVELMDIGQEYQLILDGTIYAHIIITDITKKPNEECKITYKNELGGICNAYIGYFRREIASDVMRIA